jgi:hypothetical protein
MMLIHAYLQFSLASGVSLLYRRLGRQYLQVNRLRYQLEAEKDYVVLHYLELGSMAIGGVSCHQVWI